MARGQPAPTPQEQPHAAQQAPAAPSARPFAGLIPDLRPGEGVVLLARRHPLTILRAVLFPLVLLVLWVPGLLLALSFSESLRADPLLNPGGPPAWASTAALLVYLGLGGLLLAWLLYAAANWRSDWVALTTRRVIFMEKTLFIREARREAPLLKVQNVLADYPNGVAIAFDYGDLSVDTSGTGTLTFRSVPRPRAFRDAIFGQQKLLQSSEPPPEDRRAAAVLGIVQGRDPAPPRSGRNRSAPSVVSGYGALAQFLPLAPMRQGNRVTWHKHWWFLVRAVALPAFVWLQVVGAWLAAAALADPLAFGPAVAALGWAAVGMTPVCFFWALWAWEDWRNDTYRIDGER
ncbi:MAG TPA: PH domain-containing protein, partial [Chloroflexia bacterium]|nr:PH domain-containing protein [Chloroflexia bacterium]